MRHHVLLFSIYCFYTVAICYKVKVQSDLLRKVYNQKYSIKITGHVFPASASLIFSLIERLMNFTAPFYDSLKQEELFLLSLCTVHVSVYERKKYHMTLGGSC